LLLSWRFNEAVFNQLDATGLTEYNNNLCWATSAAMWISFLTGNPEDVTVDFARIALGSDDSEVYNTPQPWHNTDIFPDVTVSQSEQENVTLTPYEIRSTSS